MPFGALNKAQIRERLGPQVETFKRLFGHAPNGFRPGGYSINAKAWPSLIELGISFGPCTIPGRVAKHKYSIHKGGELYPHWANGVSTVHAGDLHFVNFPLSIDTTQPQTRQVRYSGTDRAETVADVEDYPDLRPEVDPRDADTNYNVVAKNILRRMEADKPTIFVLSMLTHNDCKTWETSTISPGSVKA